jgi:hypothetical protein
MVNNAVNRAFRVAPLGRTCDIIKPRSMEQVADDVYAFEERNIRSYPVAFSGRLEVAARYVLVHVRATSSELAANYNPS